MATATIWDLPNYAGALFTASPKQTPFLTMIGGLTGGRQTSNFQFPTGSEYTITAVSQPNITENDSLTAPASGNFARSQDTNVTQIFHESVSISYVKMSNAGRMSGLNTIGQVNNAADEKAFQIAVTLEKIARDIEHTFLNGVYNLAGNADAANRSRGILTAISSNIVTGGGNALDKTELQEAFRNAWTNGARFQNMVLFVNAAQKQAISDLYGYAPEDRNIGGLNIKQIETDFGNVGIVLDPFMPTTVVLGAELSVCAPVFQPVPGKGNFFYEELSKTGAAESGQIFGQIGLDYGPEWMHFKITGILDPDA